LEETVNNRKTSMIIEEERNVKASFNPGFNKNYLKNVTKKNDVPNIYRENNEEYSNLIRIDKLGIGGQLLLRLIFISSKSIF
jgi:hypothetical protein